jgi:hypothetical protein
MRLASPEPSLRAAARLPEIIAKRKESLNQNCTLVLIGALLGLGDVLV